MKPNAKKSTGSISVISLVNTMILQICYPEAYQLNLFVCFLLRDKVLKNWIFCM